MSETDETRKSIIEVTSKLKGLKILLIDDESEITDFLKIEIEDLGFSVITCNDSTEAKSLIEQHQSLLAGVISDYKMPKLSGFEIRKSTLDRFNAIPFAIYSGYINRQMAIEGLELKICAFINKPAASTEVIELIQKKFLTRAISIIEEQELLKVFNDYSTTLLEQL